MEAVSLKTMCEMLNVSRRSIQCYEKAGLMMSPAKNKYGHLLYDENMVKRARMIKFLQQVGFKLREVKDIIDAPKQMFKKELISKINELKKEKAQIELIIHKASELVDSL